MKKWIYPLACALVPATIFLAVFVGYPVNVDPRNPKVEFGSPPAAVLGDEPHYITMINSLMRDGDLELKNNYIACSHGADDCGRHYRSVFLDPHVMWILNGKQVVWLNSVQIYRSPGREDVIDFKPEYTELRDRPFYSWHPYMYAFLLAPSVGLLQTVMTEESAAFVSMAATGVLSWFLLLSIFRTLSLTKWQSWLSATLVIMASPWWHYTRVLFTDGLLSFLMTLAIWIWLRSRRHDSLLSAVGLAVCFGVAAAMKPPIILCALPFVVDFIIRRRFKSLALGTFVLGSIGLAYLGLNAFLFGSPFSFNAYPLIVEFSDAMHAMFLGLHQGLLWSFPWFVLAGFGVFTSRHSRRPEIPFIFAAGCLYLLMLILVHNWFGGSQYGPRYIVPIIPFLGIPAMMAIVRIIERRNRIALLALAIIFSYSLVVNGYAGVLAVRAIAKHPLSLLLPDYFSYDIR